MYNPNPYIPDENPYYTESVKMGQKPTWQSIPAKFGFSFYEWKPNPSSVTVYDDIQISAIWKRRTPNIDINTESASTPLTYDPQTKTFILPASPNSQAPFMYVDIYYWASIVGSEYFISHNSMSLEELGPETGMDSVNIEYSQDVEVSLGGGEKMRHRIRISNNTGNTPRSYRCRCVYSTAYGQMYSDTLKIIQKAPNQ